MNRIILVGRLTRDPDLKMLPGNGIAITKFTLAVNRPRFDKSKEQEVDFVNCTCFGKRAEAIATYVQKGHRFGVEGSLRINKYTDKEGNDRWITEVLVSDFEFMQDKGNNNINNSNNNNPYNLTEVDEDEIPF